MLQSSPVERLVVMMFAIVAVVKAGRRSVFREGQVFQGAPEIQAHSLQFFRTIPKRLPLRFRQPFGRWNQDVIGFLVESNTSFACHGDAECSSCSTFKNVAFFLVDSRSSFDINYDAPNNVELCAALVIEDGVFLL